MWFDVLTFSTVSPFQKEFSVHDSISAYPLQLWDIKLQFKRSDKDNSQNNSEIRGGVNAVKSP